MSVNQKISAEQCAKIRRLADFDLEMLVSEIHDHGWPFAQGTLAMMPVADEKADPPEDSE
jgi:hypothetical protein